MDANYYRIELDTFFKRIVLLQNTLFYISNVLNRDLKKKLEMDSQSQIGSTAVVSHLGISDISGPTDNGHPFHFPTGATKKIRWKNYEDEVNNIISREASFLIAQASEAFNRFLKNSAAICLSHNSNYANERDQIFNGIDKISDFKTAIRNSNNINSTSKLFQIFEDCCPKYLEVNSNNNIQMEFEDFYQALSFFRHKVTHSSSTFTTDELNKRNWSKEIHDIFEHYFPYKEFEENTFIFKISKPKGQYTLKRISEIGFQIYKALSICEGFKWKLERQK